MSEIDIPNARVVHGNVLAGGQPSRERLYNAQEKGYRTIVNLRPEGEFEDFDEASAVDALGMRYVHIPVTGADDLNENNARRLHEALTEEEDALVMVHCASGNRVGALLACRARHMLSHDKEEALRLGQEAGLNPESPLFNVTLKVID